MSTGHADEWVHVFLGEPGDHRDRRNYTVRAHRPELDEVDIDVVLHERGLMVDWTRDAAPGDELVWGDVAGSYAPPEDTDWRLLAGDITALPAIGRIVEELPAGARAVVVAETYDPADRQEWETAGRRRRRLAARQRRGQGAQHRRRRGPRVPRARRRRLPLAGRGDARRARRAQEPAPRAGAPEGAVVAHRLLARARRGVEARYETVAPQMERIWVRGEAEGRDEEDIMDEYERALEEAGL